MPNPFDQLRIVVHSDKGVSIWDAAANVRNLVRHLGRGVIFIFNDVQIDVGVWDCEGEIVRRYYKVMDADGRNSSSSNSGGG